MIQLNDILFVVSRAYNMTPDRLKERTRLRSVSRPRQIVMYIARHYTKLSLNAVGERLGGFDHTTIMYGTLVIERMMEEDPQFNKHVRELGQEASVRAGRRALGHFPITNSEAAPASP